ncbi:MAG TPA: PEGA domain-containing protein [Thermoanaerobaculia bacterium]|nr:PEGA domain-containing protein [Thermoanaerobaculia bacterium]
MNIYPNGRRTISLAAYLLGAVVCLLGHSSPASAGAGSTSVAASYRVGVAPARPSAEFGLAVFDRQLSRTVSSRGYHRSYPYRPHYRYYPYYRPYYRWPYYARPFGYYGAWGYPAYYGGYYRDELAPDAGALDLNIKPKRAEVWVDREYLGVVDSYDGFPRYLWLREGKHRLVVYLEGYETFAREVTVRPGEVLGIRYKLREGVAKKPEELFADVAPERQDSERQDRAAARAARAEPTEPAERPRSPGRTEPPQRAEPRPRDDWRDRSSSSSRSSRVESDQRAEPGRLRLVVTPSDAVVYLDGRLLGSGDDLSRLHSDLLVDAGSHRIEVMRPGHRTWQREIVVEEGEELVVRAELEPER